MRSKILTHQLLSMAKKKEKDHDDLLEAIFGKKKNPKAELTESDIKRIFSIKNPGSVSSGDRMLMIASAVFIQNGITPDSYKILYDEAKNNPIVSLMPLEMIFGKDDTDHDTVGEEDYEKEDYDTEGLTGKPLPDADKKSLVLKIQIRGISKPPLWREVVVPADISFYSLHQVIQILFGWTNSHLWQFQHSPYDHGYTIGPDLKDTMDWDDGPTDDADETKLTAVLKKAGDKMVYVYDFGDDWIHDISVKEVTDKQADHPVCTKYKGDNPLEDIGGTWGYEEYRRMYDPKSGVTKAEKKEFFENNYFSSEKEFKEMMEEQKFDLPYVNEELECIKG